MISNNEIKEIVDAASCWLWDYLVRSGGGGFTLPLSGGADSASVATIIFSMCEKIYTDISQNYNHEYFIWKDNGKKKYKSIIKNIQLLGPKTDPEITDEKIKWNFEKKSLDYIQVKKICSGILDCIYLPNEAISGSETKDRSKFIGQNMSTKKNWKSIGIGAIYKEAKKIIYQFYHNFQKNSEKDNVYYKNQNFEDSKQKFNEQVNTYRKTKKGIIAFSLADENIQARLRMLITYLVAQIIMSIKEQNSFKLTVGCSNSDEVLIGYYTKYDASAADLNPIGTLPKKYINKILQYYSIKYHNIDSLGKVNSNSEVVISNSGKLVNKLGISKLGISKLGNSKSAKNNSNQYFMSLSQALFETWLAIPTAELKPDSPNFTIQSDEDEIGISYDQIYAIGKLRSKGYGYISIFKELLNDPLFIDPVNSKSLLHNFNNLKTKMEKYNYRYTVNRHKTVILTPAVHLLPSPDDNRFDLRPFLYNTSMDNIIKEMFTTLEKKIKDNKNKSNYSVSKLKNIYKEQIEKGNFYKKNLNNSVLKTYKEKQSIIKNPNIGINSLLIKS